MKNKPSKILFGLPEGDVIARQFAVIASALPDIKCRFVGFSWSAGRIIRKMGFEYAHAPLVTGAAKAEATVPLLAELVYRSYHIDSVPYTIRRTYSALDNFIESEISLYEPDLVVLGPIEHAVCYLLHIKAGNKNIPTITIQSSFLSDFFIVHSFGPDWEKYLAKTPVHEGDNSVVNFSGERGSCGKYAYRKARKKDSVFALPIWIRGLERVIRLLCVSHGGMTFDTPRSLFHSVVSKVFTKKWFPRVASLKSTDELVSDCVLVVLHQPALDWANPTWLELVRFALSAVPESIPLVIRPHPHEKGCPVPFDLENALQSRCTFISRAGNGPSLGALLQKSKAVLTLSSAVGMEALLAGVPVFTLAQSFYTRSGLAHRVTCDDRDLVKSLLVSASCQNVDVNDVKRFCAFLIKEYMASIVDEGTGSGAIKDRIVSRLAECAS